MYDRLHCTDRISEPQYVESDHPIHKIYSIQTFLPCGKNISRNFCYSSIRMTVPSRTQENGKQSTYFYLHTTCTAVSFTCSVKNSDRLRIQQKGPTSSYILTTEYNRYSSEATLPGQWSIFPLRRIRSAITFSIYRAFHVKGKCTMCWLLHQQCGGKDAALRYENTWKQWRQQCRRIC